MLRVARARQYVASGLFVWVLVVGCNKQPAAEQSALRAPAGVALTIAVVDAPALAEAMTRMRGEWIEQAGGSLEVALVAPQTSPRELTADLLVFPALQLGQLVQYEQLAPVRQSMLDAETYDRSGVFPLAERLARHDGWPMAVPLVVSTLLMRYDAHQLPHGMSTWQDFSSTLQSGKHRCNLPHGRDACFLFIQRAAAFSGFRPGEPLLFEADTMRARIDQPPFIRALKLFAREFNDSAELDDAPAKAATVTIEFPHRAMTTETSGAQHVAWSRLPAASTRYVASIDEWEAANLRITLLGPHSWLAGVHAASRNKAAAFRLLAWLAGAEASQQWLNASERGLPWRDAHRLAPGTEQVAMAARDALSDDTPFVIPPLPGLDEYLASLQSAIQAVTDGTASPEEGLRATAKNWDAITNRLGLEMQRDCYLRHLGRLDTP